METGLISRIQRYSTKDGPGLRSTVFMQGCNLRCQWCANPETIAPDFNVFYFKERCKQCGTCVAAAVDASIELAQTGVKIDRRRCSNLLDMVAICPWDSYEKAGREISSQELAETLLRDNAFYQTSQGGITFSGGEPALQGVFIMETAGQLKKAGVHLCLDTAGHLRWEKLRPLIEMVDLISYDIKAWDTAIHKSCTGIDNHQILENARLIAAMGKPMLIRLVIVPTRNDQIEDIYRRLDFIHSLGSAVQQVDILEYHIYGVGKYERLGMHYPLENIPAGDPQQLVDIRKYAQSLGLKNTIGG